MFSAQSRALITDSAGGRLHGREGKGYSFSPQSIAIELQNTHKNRQFNQSLTVDARTSVGKRTHTIHGAFVGMAVFPTTQMQRLWCSAAHQEPVLDRLLLIQG